MGSNYHQLHKENYLPFTITVDTTIAGSSGVGNFQLPFTSVGGADYRCIVDWGDGNSDKITTWNQAETLHNYSVAGVYTISISGRCDHFRFANLGDKLKLTEINAWGNIVWKSFESAFNGCVNMVGNFTDVPILEYVTNLSSMFRGCNLFNSNIDNWDVSNIVNFSGMFGDNKGFNQNLNSWDVSNGTNFSQMFGTFTADYSIFNNGNPSGVANPLNWITTSATNMTQMFLNARSFNCDISSFDVSNVTNFDTMFRNGYVFNNGGSANINNWTINTSASVDMGSMFRNALAFNQPLHNWNVSQVIDLVLFLANSSLSTANLDLIYNTWSTLTVQSGVNAYFAPTQYTIATSQAGRDILTNAPNNWVITDGGGI